MFPFFCVLECLNMAKLSATPLALACALEVRYPPPFKKGYLSDTCAIPSENKAKRVRYPLCNTVSKGYCALLGGYLALGR